MNNKRLIDSLLALAIVAVASFYFYKRYQSSEKKNIPPLQITKASDILKYKTVIPSEALNTAMTSGACTLFLKHSAESSLNDYANQFIDHQVDNTLKSCVGALPRVLQKKFDDIFLKCKNATREKISQECYSALTSAKTSSVATIVLPDALPTDLDAPILLHLISDKYTGPDFLENPDRTLSLIDALLIKEPQFLSGMKIKLLLIATSSLNDQEYYKEMFQELLHKAQLLAPRDQELKLLELFVKGEFLKKEEKAAPKDLSGFIEELEQESKKYPREWVYPFIKAYAYHNSSSIDEQLVHELIGLASKRASQNTLLQRTLENLNSEDEDKRKNPFVISIEFKLNDL